MSRRGLLLVAHGSRRRDANGEVRRLAGRLGARLAGPFELSGCAFLELAEPSLATGLRALVERGADEIVILPYFLAAGRHVADDIPAIVGAARAEHPSVRFRLQPYLGTSDGLVELLARTANRALRNADAASADATARYPPPTSCA